jgi:nicotinamidase-related amidase
MPDVHCDHARLFRFDPASTALLVIDLQRDFLDPRGHCAAMGDDIAPLQRIVPTCRRVLDWARAHRLLIVHTREGHRPDLSDLSEAKQARSRDAGEPIGASGPLGRWQVIGEYGHDFIDAMQPLPGEHVIDKPGFGAFHATDLGQRLAAAGITHLILMGITSQCCVFSTLREAIDRGYWCLTLRDACAAFDPSMHEATFAMIASEGHLFGWSANAEALIASLRSSGER